MAIFKQVSRRVDGVQVTERVEITGAELVAFQEVTKPNR